MPKSQPVLRYKSLLYLVALLFTLSIFALHMLPNMDSMLNENNTRISHGFLRSQIDYHQEIAPFARRPLTSFLIESIRSVFGFRLGHGFILINFTLLFCSGCLMFRLSKNLKATTLQAFVNMTAYFVSFSIVFAFFPPIFSYDEPIQYCFLLLALLAFVRQKWFWYVPAFTMALIARETSILLLPALFFFAPGKPEEGSKGLKDGSTAFSKKRLKVWGFILLPVVFYGFYLLVFIDAFDQLQATRSEMASRYSCFLENFQNLRNTVESSTSLYLALAPFLYLTILCFQKNTLRMENKRWMHAFLLSALINTPIVLLMAFARETRLFVLPLFFIWPMFAQLYGRDLKRLFSVDTYNRLLRKWMYLLPFLALNLLNYWYCFRFYTALGLGPNTYFAAYLFAMNFFILLHFSLHTVIRRKNSKHGPPSIM